MGGGRMGKNSYQTWASSSSIMFNGDVLMLECWCPIICAVRKVNSLKKPKKGFLCLSFVKGLFNNGYVLFNVMHFYCLLILIFLCAR